MSIPTSCRPLLGRRYAREYLRGKGISGRAKPSARGETAAYAAGHRSRAAIVGGYMGEAEVVDPTWIDVAYTWSWPGSRWVSKALRVLEEQGVYQVGRAPRWIFQGIADSIRDGFIVGNAFRD